MFKFLKSYLWYHRIKKLSNKFQWISIIIFYNYPHNLHFSFILHSLFIIIYINFLPWVAHEPCIGWLWVLKIFVVLLLYVKWMFFVQLIIQSLIVFWRYCNFHKLMVSCKQVNWHHFSNCICSLFTCIAFYEQ